jgi:hypothetical protein
MSKTPAPKVTKRADARKAPKAPAKKSLATKTKPMSFEEAKERVFEKFADGLRRLAK